MAKGQLPRKYKSIKELEKKLRAVLYPLIKQRDIEYAGARRCISCGSAVRIDRRCHAGHFAKAELCNMVYRYREDNINLQCSQCNMWKAGNTLAYEKGMIAKWGAEVTQDIKENYNKKLPMGFDERGFLEEKIMYYKGVSSLKQP